jgi:hypothetical protein
MRKWSGLFAAIVIGLCLALAGATSGSAVPIDSAKLPQSLQRLMDSPVLQVKKSCKKEGYCLKCTKTCDKYKKSDYCQMEKNKSDTSCCKHYENDCKCVSCLPM